MLWQYNIVVDPSKAWKIEKWVVAAYLFCIFFCSAYFSLPVICTSRPLHIKAPQNIISGPASFELRDI